MKNERNQQPRPKETGYIGSDRYGFYAGSNTHKPTADTNIETALKLARGNVQRALDPLANKNRGAALSFTNEKSGIKTPRPPVYSAVKLIIFLISALAAFSACGMGMDTPYGKLGNADVTDTYYPGDEIFESFFYTMSGVWYSHSKGVRLDSYRLGGWNDFDAVMAGKDALFPSFEPETYTEQSGSAVPGPGDYFVLYDDTPYGQSDDGSGGQTESFGYGYLGVVRALNIFNGNLDRGAIIIEYFKGCSPRWLETSQGLQPGQKPFFGIYYNVLNNNTVQMANAVDVASLVNNGWYYTETETLAESIDKNDVENEAEFISWGVCIPQDREK
jgi:hypothetical protein